MDDLDPDVPDFLDHDVGKIDRDRLEQLDKLLGELRTALRAVRIP